MLFFNRKNISIQNFFSDTYVDIHSHLLPGIDDGAKDIDDAINLIKKLVSYGIKNIITTPHIMGDVYPNTSEIIKRKLDEVRQELTNRKIEVNLKAAAEYMLDEQFVDLLKKKDILTLDGFHILVEMSFFSPPMNLFDTLFDIQLKGYKPILAHPERYQFYHGNLDNFYKLKKAGCLFQLNLLSLTDQYGKGVTKSAKNLLENQLYDFAGTDTHHNNHLHLLETIATSKNLKLLQPLISKNKQFHKI